MTSAEFLHHRRHISSSAAAAAGGDGSAGSGDGGFDAAMSGEISEEMMERINQATATIGAMITEVSKDVFTADPSGEQLSAEDTRQNEVEAVRKAIAVRMDSLDEAFLMTLGGFVRASAEDGDAAMHDRLALMHQEVVAEVRARLPPEVQLLDQLVGMQDSEDRAAIIRARIGGGPPGVGAGSQPPVDATRLDVAASQFIEDMEDKTEVPDRRLLARVCLVREEVQNVAREVAFEAGRAFSPTADRSAQLRGGVPRRAVAFLQAVMKVPSKEGRLAYLRKAFTSDWEGAAPVRAGAASEGDEKSDAVRPGRFLTALNATQAEMTADGKEVGLGVLERLEDVRRETLEVLMDMAEAE